jgi:diguanylate cyclase
MSPEHISPEIQADSRLPAESASAWPSGNSHVAIFLCVVTNFTTLRRQTGTADWRMVMASLVNWYGETLPDSIAEQIAPDCIQVTLPTKNREMLETQLRATMEECERTFLARGIGLVLAIGAATTLDDDQLTLQEHAERALAEACRGQRLVVLTVEPDSQAFEEIAMLRDLPLAAANEELFLLYQPKIHIRNQTVPSAEALIRWLHPVHGLIMPDSFIAAADESGDILEIALWTLRRVIADQALLAERGHRLRLFINVSGRLLTDSAFIDSACALVQASQAEIGFEITETSVIHDPDLAIANLERCAVVGIDLAIDDYGSGLSSLAYLKRLPARELKIDKQFVTQLTSSHRDPLIVRSTIDLAHALDMEVTAEGVETPAALALLTVMGCEMVQGFLISAPVRLAALSAFLDDYRFETIQADTVPTVMRPASFWKRA